MKKADLTCRQRGEKTRIEEMQTHDVFERFRPRIRSNSNSWGCGELEGAASTDESAMSGEGSERSGRKVGNEEK